MIAVFIGLDKEEMALQALIEKIRAFNKERNWEKFHSPKNLAMAFNVEVAEIAEHFQWLSEDQSRKLSPKQLEKITEEIGDAAICLLNLADKLGIDPLKAAEEKLEKNKQKYPAEKVRGKNSKYTEYK